MTSNPSPRSEDSLITASKPMGDTLISATFTMSRKQWATLRAHLQEARDRDPDEHVALRIVRDIRRVLHERSISALHEGTLKECDCCGEMKSDVRTSYIPHAGDTSACAECRGEGAPQDLRAQVIEECAKWHDGQFDKYAKLAKEAADRQDMSSNGFHADTAQHHMLSAAALRARVLHGSEEDDK